MFSLTVYSNTIMRLSALHQILGAFEVEYTEIHEAQSGYRNSTFRATTDKGDVNLLLFKRGDDPASIRAFNKYADKLHDAGLPTRSTFDPRILRVTKSEPTTYASLYKYLPGTTIAWEAYTRRHLKALGHMLGDIHEVSRTFEDLKLPDACDVQIGILSDMETYFAREGVQSAAHSKLGFDTRSVALARYSKLVASLQRSTAQHPLHMDFVRGNVLFDRYEISGVIDFEKAAIGDPIIDVARTLAFLYVDSKYKSEEDVRKYFLQRGYFKRSGQRLSSSQLKAEEPLIEYFMLHDLYKMMLHNPYESLSENAHFTRTFDALLSRGVLAGVS